MDRIINLLNNNNERNDDIVVSKVPETRKKKKKVKDCKVAPVIKIKDDYTEPPHPNLLRLPFSLLEIAPKGSGKTTLLHNILVWYNMYFDNVFIFSPTIKLDRKWKQLIEKLRIPDNNLFSEYSENDLSKIVEKVKQFNSNKDNEDKCKTLLIFDDIVQDLPKNKRKTALNKLALNHRHFNISHIIISQSYKKLDCCIRNNTTGIILFNIDNNAERQKVFEELAGRMGTKRFEELFNEATREKYSFMFLNYDSREVFKCFTDKLCHLDDL